MTEQFEPGDIAIETVGGQIVRIIDRVFGTYNDYLVRYTYGLQDRRLVYNLRRVLVSFGGLVRHDRTKSV